MKKLFLLLIAFNGFFLQSLNAVFLETTTKSTNKFLFSNGKTLSLPKNLQVNLLSNPEAVEILNAQNITISLNEIGKKYKNTKTIRTIINKQYVTFKVSSKFSENIENNSIFIFINPDKVFEKIELNTNNFKYKPNTNNELNNTCTINNIILTPSSESDAPAINEEMQIEEEYIKMKNRMSINHIISFDDEKTETDKIISRNHISLNDILN